MKTCAIITSGIFFGIVFLSATHAISLMAQETNTLKKGNITAELARTLGIHFSDVLLTPYNPLKTEQKALKMRTPTHIDTAVVPTSAEEVIAESITEDITENIVVNTADTAPTPSDPSDPFLSTTTEIVPTEFSPETQRTAQSDTMMLPTALPETIHDTLADTPADTLPPNSPSESAITLEEQLSPASETELMPLESAPETFQVPSVEEIHAEPAEDMLKPAEQEHVASQNTHPATVFETTGKPGDVALEGVQIARLTLKKTAPENIQVGQVSTWTITVRNEGKTTANGVQIHDSIPQGATLENTHPVAQVSQTGHILWNVGNMPAGTMAVVKMELKPTQEGEIGSVASVTSRTEASAKTVVTRPMLKVETFGDEKILLGNPTELSIVVTNPGTGVTRGVILSETVPPELQFEGGAELRYEVGDLQPGESKTTKLPLTAVRAGKFANKITAHSESGLLQESILEMEVTAPAIEVKLNGPTKRFLDKEGTYRLSLTNSGTAPAQNVEMKLAMPNSWKFIRANNFGTFVPEQRATLWRLEELGAGETAEAEMVVTPTEIGNFTLNYQATADICQVATGTKNVSVEGIAALMFQVVDSNDPIQIGEDTKYTVEVVNQGSKPAENVQIAVEIPSGLHLVSSEENARAMTTSTGKEVVFTPIPSLGAKATKVYRFTLRGVTSGDQRISVKLSSREFSTPIVKEESTRVFKD